MGTQTTEPAAGGFAGDPAEAFNPPKAGGCCGGPATGTGPAGGQTEVCCGTAAEARAAEPVGAAPGKRSTASGGCCGEAAKAGAVETGAGCCG